MKKKTSGGLDRNFNIDINSLVFDVKLPMEHLPNVKNYVQDTEKHIEIHSIMMECGVALEDAVEAITEYLSHIGKTFNEIDIEISEATKALSTSNVNNISGDQR